MIPVNQPKLDGREKELVNDCIESAWISSEGPHVEQFEVEFARSVKRKHGIAVCNGSAALDIAIAALEIRSGDEVIMPTFTIISCAAAVIRAGATPVLVDSDPITWNMDVNQIEEKITPNTKAIMVVHIYGLPVDMGPVLDLAKTHSLMVIEDAAEMIGQTYRGQLCGSFGDVSTFSFYPNKLVTTGEGGMVLTDSETIADKCRSLRNLCFQPSRRFIHEELGWNYRMTNLQAALGRAQLQRLDEFVVKKREIGKLYTQLLADIPILQLPMDKTEYAHNIYWVYGLVLKDTTSSEAENVMQSLKTFQVGTRPFFWPMHEQPVFNKMGFFGGESHPVAEKLARKGFYIPSGLTLTSEQIHTVAHVLHEVMC